MKKYARRGTFSKISFHANLIKTFTNIGPNQHKKHHLTLNEEFPYLYLKTTLYSKTSHTTVDYPCIRLLHKYNPPIGLFGHTKCNVRVSSYTSTPTGAPNGFPRI